MNKFVYPKKRPKLVIERLSKKEISNCYEESSWKVTSDYPLKKETIVGLYKLGLVGIGQEFSVISKCDGKEEPAGYDTVECVEVDSNGKALPGPAINPYSDEPYKPHKYAYYEYICISRCDSSG